MVWSGHCFANACSAAPRGIRCHHGRRAGRAGRGWSGPATSPPTPAARRGGCPALILGGALGEQVAGGLVRPFLRQRLQRGAAGVFVVILDGALGEQVAGGLVRPMLRQRLKRGAAGFAVVILDGALGEQVAGALVRPHRG